MIEDTIIEELHQIREDLARESVEKGIPLYKYLSKDLPVGHRRANLKPARIDLSKLVALKQA